MIEQLIGTIDELNLHIANKDDYSPLNFSLSSNGYIYTVSFGDYILWNSEDDTRKFFEETNEYEDFTNYIKNLYNEYVEELVKFKF